MIKIGIIDLKINNIKSINNAAKLFGQTYLINNLESFREDTDIIILPGNGSFFQGMKIIRENKYDKLIYNFVKKNKKLIGICLGLQLLMNSSEEAKDVEGLSLIEGSVKKLKEKNLKVPLLGWYDVNFKDDIKTQSFYFNNGFIVEPNEKDLIRGAINDKIPAYLNKENIHGFQFHPEKSTYHGLKLLGQTILK
jgi:imidazole glycerol-phosphate synthase subunit HisH